MHPLSTHPWYSLPPCIPEATSMILFTFRITYYILYLLGRLFHTMKKLVSLFLIVSSLSIASVHASPYETNDNFVEAFFSKFEFAYSCNNFFGIHDNFFLADFQDNVFIEFNADSNSVTVKYDPLKPFPSCISNLNDSQLRSKLTQFLDTEPFGNFVLIK